MDKVTRIADKKSLPPCVLTAHIGEIAVLAVNAQGTMLASGSTKVKSIKYHTFVSCKCHRKSMEG